MKDYRKYRLGMKEILLCLLQACFLSVMIAFLFYRSLWGMITIIIVLPAAIGECRKNGKKSQQQELRDQFQECIRIAAGALHAGLSPENAFVEAEKDIGRMLGETAVMKLELQHINQQTKLNQPLEKLLSDLAERGCVEEISTFAQVFGYAKRSGGDFIKIINDTADRIGSRAEITREIQTLIASRQMEQRIMNVIPMGILLFVNLGSPGFFDTMYSSLFGRLVMTGCLIVYGAAYLLSKRIVDIEV